jgi:hypothetical protein
MLTLKELRLANETKVATSTALLAGAGSPCTSPGGCRSTSTSVQSSSGGGQQKKPTANAAGGGGYGTNGKKKWQPKKPGGGYQTSFSGYQQGGQQRPIGPWFCFSSGVGPQQQPSNGSWRGVSAPGLLGVPPQAHTAFAPLQVSPASQVWDTSGLIAALNQMQQGGWVMELRRLWSHGG